MSRTSFLSWDEGALVFTLAPCQNFGADVATSLLALVLALTNV
jgi:hypothetical protein